MRTQTLALYAAVAFGTSIVNGAPYPVPAPGSYNSEVFAVSRPNSTPDNSAPSRLHPHIGIKEIRDAIPDHTPSIHEKYKIGPRAGASSDDIYTNDSHGVYTKRTDDNGTLGGNAYTGNSGDVDGGDVVNQSDNYGMPTLFNMNSNNAGGGGESVAGCANGGHGNGRGAGGNAYSGSAGNANGGNVWNSGAVMNVDSNNAGGAGHSQTGCATGGDVSDTPDTPTRA